MDYYIFIILLTLSIYFYSRTKINLQYLLDFMIIASCLLALYIMIAPHRIHMFLLIFR